MAQIKSEVILTMNGKVVIDVLEQMKQKAAEAKAQMDKLEPNSQAWKDAKQYYDAYQSAQTSVITSTERLDHAIKNLSGTSLQNLRRALAAGKKDMQNFTGSPEDLKRLDETRKKMREVGNQIRLLEGQYVEIKNGLSSLTTQSDQWLNKAIKQQQELMSVTRRGTAEYESQKQVLAQLTQESERRSAKSPYAHTVDNAKAIANQDSINLGNGQQHDVTKKDLEWSKNRLQSELNNTPLTDTAKVKELQDALANVDQRMKALNGDTQTAAMSSTKLNSVLGNMKTASLNDLKAASKELNKQLGELAPSSDAAKQVKKQLAELDKEIKQVEEDMVDVNDVIARSKNGKASLDELKKAYKQLGDEMNQLETGGKEFKEKQKALDQLKQKIDAATGATNKHASSWKTALKNLTAYVGMFTVFNKAKEMMTAVIKKNFEYSSSLTDIRKVSGMAMEDVNKLSEELAKIDTRTSIDGLAQLAYQGAKLGMGKYGVEGMAGFVRAADKINVAIGEEMGQEALPALSKLVETMGLIPKMGIEKAMDATGSAMFKLSSTSTATSGNIVEFAKRLTGVARTAGITTDQLLALGSASDSMYLMPEVASTAMSKFVVALQRNHNLIEKDLGIQQGTIKQMYAAGNAMDAIVLVLQKMKETGNMNALGGIFKDLGSDGQRLVTAMVTMSKNVDMLRDHLYESKEAFEEASAVTNEYTMQNQSAAGILERANNLWEKAFVNPDGVNNVKDLAEAWYNISNTILNSPIYNGSLHASLWLVIKAAQLFLTLLPAIINYLMALGISKAITFMVGLSRAIWAATTAQTAFNAATKANIYVAVASVIMTVVGVLWSFVSASNEAAKAEAEAERRANAWKNRLGEAQRETDTLTRKLHAYKTALDQANLSQEQRNTQISKFNRDFRSYISKLGIEIKNVSDLKKHYNELATEIQRATYYRLKEKAKEDALPQYQKDRLNAANRVKDALAAHGYARQLNNQTNVQGASNPGEDDVWTTKMIMDQFARGTSANELYRQIITSRYPGVTNLKVDKKAGTYTYTDAKGKVQTNRGDQALLSSLRHYQNATKRELDKDKEIDDYFSPFVPEDYHPWTDDELGTLDNEAPDKKAIAEAKREKREQAKAWRDELKQAQNDAQAVMDDVRNFYNRQINEKLNDAIALGMDKTEQDLFVEPVRRRMNEALEQVRLAIAMQKNNWNVFKQTMNSDLLEQADETGVNLSQNLLDNIQDNNIEALAKKMRNLSGNLNKPYTSTIAEIFAKATQNEQAKLKLEAKQAEARRKVAAEHDYTGIVQTNMYDDFNTMGYANPTLSEVSDKAAFDKRKQNIIDMFEVARKGIAELYTINPATASGQGALMTFLFGDDPDGMGARIKATLGTNEADWQAFYAKLVQYSDQYTEAEKKAADERKKVYDFLWNRKGMQASQDKRTNSLSQINKGTERFWQAGQGNDSDAPRSGIMGGSKFMDQFSYNGDIEQSKMEITLLQEKIKWLQLYGATSEQIAEQQTLLQQKQDAYISALMSDMKAKADAVYALYSPLEEFGTNVGNAFAEMTEDAEKGRDSFKAAIGDMINAMMKQTVQMTQEYIKRRIMQKVNDKLVSTQIKKSTKEQTGLEEKGSAATTAIQEAAGEARVLLTQKVGDAVVKAVGTQAQQTTQQEQAAAQESVNTEASKTTANINLGIASGAAKTIGSLGWWGIPLVAAISATLNALLSFAMSSVSKLFGGGASTDTSKNTKLVSGMLTYDSGNVQDLKPFVANDGSIYWAAEGNMPSSGASLITSPTATSINGRPSLVAENGPELVIGRETTKAMMMNNPSLLKALVNYDANYSGRRAYDAGNIAATLSGLSVSGGASDAALNNAAAANAALVQVASLLLQRLQEPINANVNMYGTNGLYERMRQANQFMKGKR